MDNKLTWWAGVGQSALLYLTGVNKRDFFLEQEACRIVNERGRREILEMFGDRLRMPAPSCAGLSYGHLASLGARVSFPDDSEPNVLPLFSNLEEGIRWLKRDFDFADNDLFRTYHKIFEYLKAAFPGERVVFSGYSYQGPITSAVLLRGEDFYMDLYDEPELSKEFLELLIGSVVRFKHFLNRINGLPEVDAASSYIGDDLSSLVSPWLWSEFVVPSLKRYYEGTTTGRRNIHVENLSPEHLPNLEAAGISFYDPSVSALLSPRIIRERIPIDFTWRLLSIRIPEMTVDEVVRWVYHSYEEGARNLHTYMTNVYCSPEHQPKAKAFMDTCENLAKENA